MASSLERPELHVEGKDDEHALSHLLVLNGINPGGELGESQIPKIEEKGGFEKLLSGVELSVRLGTERTVGFVIDANFSPEERWTKVRDRLRKSKVDAPDRIPETGYIGRSTKFQTRVGVWMMPDNKRSGSLEHFLRTLIDENNPLIDHAQKSTSDAKTLGATFRDVDLEKATIHSWLAWQEVPGQPYGTAIRARYFRHDSTAAMAFVSWFRKLFELPAID